MDILTIRVGQNLRGDKAEAARVTDGLAGDDVEFVDEDEVDHFPGPENTVDFDVFDQVLSQSEIGSRR